MDNTETQENISAGKRKLILQGAGVAMVGLIASASVQAAPGRRNTNHVRYYEHIEDMVADEFSISNEDIIYSGTWSANTPATIATFFIRLPYSAIGLTSADVDDGMIIGADNSSCFVRLLENRNPDLAMWKADNGLWDTAFSNAITYIQEKQHIINNNAGINSVTNQLMVSPGVYEFSDSVVIERKSSGESITSIREGISIVGKSSTGTVLKFPQSSGLHIKGLDGEAAPGMQSVYLENIQIDGDENVNSNTEFGLKFENCSHVEINNCFIRNFYGSSSSATQLVLHNVACFKLEGGIISGYPDKEQQLGGYHVVTITASGGWRVSNIQFVYTMISRGAGAGVFIDIEDGNSAIDNVYFDNVVFSHNVRPGVLVNEGPQVPLLGLISNVAFTNCHFENVFENISSPLPREHINVGDVMGVSIEDSIFLNAQSHIRLSEVQGFLIRGNRIINNGGYNGANKGVIIDDGQLGGSSYGRIGANAFNNLARTVIASDAKAAPPRVFDDFLGLDAQWFT